jgi:hypothetical protein
MVLGMIGCSSEMELTQPDNESGIDVILLENNTVPERKIIYEVDVTYDVEELSEAATFLASLLQEGEWFDREVMQTNVYYYDVRIKTERLDEFIAALNERYEVMTYQKVGTDISLEYQDAANRILALETQLTRLLELYDTASLSDMIVINREISNIEVELAELQGTLNEFDSLVEYSEIHLRFYGNTIITRSPFFNRLLSAFVDGWNGVVSFIDGFFIVVAAVLPFAIVFGIPGFFLVVRIRKHRRVGAPKKPVE